MGKKFVRLTVKDKDSTTNYSVESYDQTQIYTHTYTHRDIN